MKKVISLLSAVVLIISVIVVFSYATEPSLPENTVVTILENGDYIISYIEELPGEAQAASAFSSKTGKKVNNYFNKDHVLQYTVVVEGTFRYDGKTSRAVTAKYGYKISNSEWKFISGMPHCYNNVASATCTFSCKLLGEQTTTVALTCSPAGKLS